MKRVKVGIIDSGINWITINGSVTQKFFCTKEERDINGHGTMCAKLIETLAHQEVDFISAKIFNKELKATEQQIVDAIKYMIEMQVDIINMSLSVDLSESFKLYNLCQRLGEMGVILISSVSNSGRKTLFEDYNNIITVSGNSFFDSKKYWFQYGKAVCDVEPVLVCKDEGTYGFFGGNSKATALFTSIMVDAWNIATRKFDFDKIKKDSLKASWDISDICRTSAFLNSKNSHLYERKLEVLKVIEGITGVSLDILKRENDWFGFEARLSANQVKDILNYFAQVYNFQIPNQDIFMEYFRNINTFMNFLKIQKGEKQCINYQAIQLFV